jgi:hypothetical protein
MKDADKLKIIFNKFNRRYDAIAKDVVRDLIAGLQNADDMKGIALLVRRVFKKYNVNAGFRQQIIDTIAPAVSVGAGVSLSQSREVMLKKWYLENAVTLDGERFSSAINDVSRIGEVEDLLKSAFRNNQSWAKAAQDLRDTGIQKGDVAKDVDELLTRARQGFRLAGDEEGYKEYRREIERVQRRINSLKEPDTSTLKRAYQNVVDLTSDASAAEIERAAKYAIYFKAKYNAQRIVQSEITRAYKKGFISAVHYDEDAIGWQWVLSADHPEFDICDLYATADMYGMGPGRFPQDVDPPFAHPHDWCGHVMVYRGEADANTIDDFDPKATRNFIKGLSEEDQKSLMGVRDSVAFRENPNKWRHYVNGWQDHEKAEPLPKELLYEKK